MVSHVVAALPIDGVVAHAQSLAQQQLLPQACVAYAAWLLARSQAGQRDAPACAVAWFNLGVLRAQRGLLAEAVAAYQQALRVRPDLSAARVNLGLALERLGRSAEALALWQQGLPSPEGQTALLNHVGRVNEKQRRFALAERALRQSLSLDAQQPDVVQHWVHLRAKQCVWPALVPLVDAWGSERPAGDVLRDVGPFGTLSLCDDPQVARANAAAWLAARGWPVRPAGARAVADGSAAAAWPVPAAAGRLPRKLRVGYASADLHHHATGMLMVEVLEHSDRSRFELLAFSWGPDDGSPLRARLKAAFDGWHEIGALSDAQALDLVRREQVDVWVDLKGLTQDARPGLFAERAAPVQVNFLGYPGSLPLAHMDYCLADAVIAPPELRHHYAEAVVCLPGSYQPNDRKRVTAAAVPSRAELGLPEGAFVFCSFNNNYKITPEVFGVWMHLLQQRPGSVLWLIRSHALAEQNLRAHAQAQGVAPERIVFAPMVHIADHLARHGHADLFLDTFPYGAHTTASDALWSGLPVLTRMGESFASRVAASLLTAAGVPELVTRSVAEYEALALALSADPARLRGIRERLLRSRGSCVLFDTERYTRHLEDAFALMWLRQAQGLPPADMQVPARAAG